MCYSPIFIIQKINEKTIIQPNEPHKIRILCAIGQYIAFPVDSAALSAHRKSKPPACVCVCVYARHLSRKLREDFPEQLFPLNRFRSATRARPVDLFSPLDKSTWNGPCGFALTKKVISRIYTPFHIGYMCVCIYTEVEAFAYLFAGTMCIYT